MGWCAHKLIMSPTFGEARSGEVNGIQDARKKGHMILGSRPRRGGVLVGVLQSRAKTHRGWPSLPGLAFHVSVRTLTS